MKKLIRRRFSHSMVAGNFNVHSTLWSSPLLRDLGERVEEHNLCLLNIMSAPIFGGRSSSIVDLTWAMPYGTGVEAVG